MKKSSLIILFVIIPITSFCQTYFSFTKCINNYWGEWKYSNPYRTIDGGYLLNGTYDEFIIYAYDKHPSQYIMKVKLFAMSVDNDKKAKKQRIKTDQWYEYTGTVEYYTNGLWDKFKDIVNQWPYVPDASYGEVHTVSATIKIQPYKKNPKVYNILFEGYGIGINLD